jgi:glycerol-3-phosphate dehydrogenase
MLSADEVRARLPGLPEAGLTGGALWYDAQVESTERLLLGFLRAAAADGAELANYVEVTGLLRDGARVVGVQARDVESGDKLQVRARTVVSAAGSAAAQVMRMAGVDRKPPRFVEAMNLVLACPAVRDTAVGARARGRFLVLVPWRDRSILGTEYSPPTGNSNPPLEERVGQFIDVAREAFPWAALGSDDVAIVHRGRVPGRSGSDLVTRHRLIDHERAGAPGLFSLLSAKYSTARAAAQDAVDAVIARLGIATPPCRTAVTPLPFARALEGSLTDQARAAAREEMALHLADAVLRRLDVGTAGTPAPAEVAAVASTMAEELGWSDDRLQDELNVLRGGLPRPSPAA